MLSNIGVDMEVDNIKQRPTESSVETIIFFFFKKRENNLPQNMIFLKKWHNLPQNMTFLVSVQEYMNYTLSLPKA